MLVGANHSRIDHQPFQIPVFAQGLEHTLPNAFLGPAVEPHKDTVPFAETFRQVSPRDAGFGDVVDGVEEQSVVFFTDGHTWITESSRQLVLDPIPVLITHFMTPTHPEPP
jgi:hypothetical protein